MLALHLNVKNLTNTKLKLTAGSADNRPIQREFYGITGLAGFTLNF